MADLPSWESLASFAASATSAGIAAWQAWRSRRSAREADQAAERARRLEQYFVFRLDLDVRINRIEEIASDLDDIEMLRSRATHMVVECDEIILHAEPDISEYAARARYFAAKIASPQKYSDTDSTESFKITVDALLRKLKLAKRRYEQGWRP